MTVPVLFNPCPSSSGQHTITWYDTITVPVYINQKPATLAPGSCNLYKYPRVGFEHLREGKAIVPPLEQLFVLEEVVRALVLTADKELSIANRRDAVGATPIMGLLVANTKPALSLALSVYEARPSLLADCHSPGPFDGENALHILSVNRREAELCRCIELAASKLKAPALKEVFWKQAVGGFFQDQPMCFYGGTPVSYAVAFSLQEALCTMLRCSLKYRPMGGIIDFNDHSKSACRQTGLLPLHVAVANSLTSMFNFLCDLPGLDVEFDDLRARPSVLSNYGARTELALMTPLQTAVKLGDQKLVQYILRTQSKQEWEWGPVSSFNLDLNGIDSVGDTPNDVMEICARLDANERTQEMLLETFMGGLMHSLFEEKFHKRGLKWVHYLMRTFDFLYISSLYALAMLLRLSPDGVLMPQPDQWMHMYLPYLILGFIVPLLEEDLRVSFVYWQNARSGPQDPDTKALLKKGGLSGRTALYWRDVRMLLSWMQSHNMPVKFAGQACAVVTVLLLMQRRSWGVDDPRWDSQTFTARDRTDVLLIPIAFASFLHGLAFFSSLLFPFETLAVTYRTCFQMFFSDVKNWVILFVIFLINYGMVMFVVYPSFPFELTNNLTVIPDSALAAAAVAEDPTGGAFMNPIAATQSLVELGFIGERVELDVLTGISQYDGTPRASMKLALFVVFLCFYVVYVTMSLILLLNLLIAMMGDTYSSAKEHATRAFRVNFARRVLRLELQMLVASRMGLVNLNCGTRKGGLWVFNYRNYKPNAEGGGTGGRTSIFDADVEKEAAEDEEDDDGPGGGNEDDTLDSAAVQAPGAAPADAEAQLTKLKKLGKKVVIIERMKNTPRGDVSIEDLGDDI